MFGKKGSAVFLAVLCIGLTLFLFDSVFAGGPRPQVERNPQIGVSKINDNLSSQDILTKGVAVLPPDAVGRNPEPFVLTVTEGDLDPITQSRRLAERRVVESLSALGCKVMTSAEARKRLLEASESESTDPLVQKLLALQAYPGSLSSNLSRPDWAGESPANLYWRREATKALGEYLGVGYLLRAVLVSRKVEEGLQLTIYFDLYDTKTGESVLYVVGRGTREAEEKTDIAKMACETGLNVALKEVAARQAKED